jgi:putative sigma-54 modulation protein
MKVIIQSVKFKTDIKLENFVKEKVQKLSSTYNGILGSEIILRLDHSDVQENKITEIKLEIPGNELFAKKQAKSFEEATDNAIEALKKQLDKHKEKLRNN